MTGALHTRPGLAIWQGIETADPPAKRHDYPDLLAMAEDMLAVRRKRFPAMVSGGKIDQADADRQIETFEAIVADWRWIVTGEGEPPSILSLHDRRAALDTSLATIAGIARDRGGFDEQLAHQAQCLVAMRWHLECVLSPRVHFFASLTHQLRASGAGKQREQSNA